MNAPQTPAIAVDARRYWQSVERSAQIGPMPAGALYMAPALLAAVTATLAFGWNGAAPLEAARQAAHAIVAKP